MEKTEKSSKLWAIFLLISWQFCTKKWKTTLLKASISNYRCHTTKCSCPIKLVWKSFLDTILQSRSLCIVQCKSDDISRQNRPGFCKNENKMTTMQLLFELFLRTSPFDLRFTSFTQTTVSDNFWTHIIYLHLIWGSGSLTIMHTYPDCLKQPRMGCLNQVDIKRRSLTWYTARIIAPLSWRWGRIVTERTWNITEEDEPPKTQS